MKPRFGSRELTSESSYEIAEIRTLRPESGLERRLLQRRDIGASKNRFIEKPTDIRILSIVVGLWIESKMTAVTPQPPTEPTEELRHLKQALCTGPATDFLIRRLLPKLLKSVIESLVAILRVAGN